MQEFPKTEVTAAGLLLLFAGAVIRGIVVPGWVYQAERKRREEAEREIRALRLEVKRIHESYYALNEIGCPYKGKDSVALPPGHPRVVPLGKHQARP